MNTLSNLPVTIFHDGYVGSCLRADGFLFGRMLARSYTKASDGNLYQTGRIGFCYEGVDLAEIESEFKRFVESDKSEEQRQIEQALEAGKSPGLTAPASCRPNTAS